MAIYENTFQLDLDDWYDSYNTFIKVLRRDLGVEKYNGLPMLPQISDNPDYFEITIENARVRVILRFRHYDLYLIGFQDQNQVWYEIGNEGEIEGSIPLRIGLNYEHIQNYARKALQKLKVNFWSIEEGTICLGESEDPLRKRAKYILVFIVAISEAMRFEKIKDLIAMNDSEKELGRENANIFNGWEDACKFYGGVADNPPNIEGLWVAEREDLFEKLGILHNFR